MGSGEGGFLERTAGERGNNLDGLVGWNERGEGSEALCMLGRIKQETGEGAQPREQRRKWPFYKENV